MLKCLVSKVRKALSLSTIRIRSAQLGDDGFYSDSESEAEIIMVPEDVREGHFAIVSIKGEETKRFIVELSYLTDPAFLRLLEQAKEEFGFRQKGALALPCRPQELHNILENQRVEKANVQGVDACT